MCDNCSLPVPLDSSNSVEKLCVSWAFSLIECVAVWALKLPVPHTDVLKPTSHKAFLRNYGKQKKWQQTLDTNAFIHKVLFFLISLYILYNFSRKNKKTLKYLSNSDIIMTKYYIKKENKLYEKSNRYRGGPGRTYGGV